MLKLLNKNDDDAREKKLRNESECDQSCFFFLRARMQKVCISDRVTEPMNNTRQFIREDIMSIS